MSNLKLEKKQLREKISILKEGYTIDELELKSSEVMSVVEILGVFQDAKNIFIYMNMDREVATVDFIEKWKEKKNFYLPRIIGDEMFFRKYISTDELEKSPFGVLEPKGDNFLDYKSIDLIIVPGVAFDRLKNRMGYGKGFYDIFLSNIKTSKVGICFDFQLFDSVPANSLDVKMDYIISENDLIW